jgi:hypothetical protein
MKNSINIHLYVLIISLLVFTSPRSLIDSLYDINTVTPTISIRTQTQTGIENPPSETETPSVTPSLTPTTTLMPLPEITLVFPAPTRTPHATETQKLEVSTPTSTPATDNIFVNISSRTRVISIVVALLWLLLAIFIVIYIRQFK